MDGSVFFDDTTFIGGLGPGSYVMTTQGELPVEWLEAGDKLVTRDHGAQSLLWAGRLRAENELGLSLPNPVKLPVPDDGVSAQTDPLHLAPAHLVLLDSPLLETHFHTAEAMCRIVDISRRKRMRFQSVSMRLTYHQLLLPRKELIMVNGLWVSSLSLEDAGKLKVPESVLEKTVQERDTSPRLVLEPWEAKLIRILTDQKLNIRHLLRAA